MFKLCDYEQNWIISLKSNLIIIKSNGKIRGIPYAHKLKGSAAFCKKLFYWRPILKSLDLR